MSPTPPGTGWASATPSPLLDAGVATCCKCCVRSEGGTSGDSPHAVGRYGPRIGGRGMQQLATVAVQQCRRCLAAVRDDVDGGCGVLRFWAGNG
jgi:hypothetical protein